MKEIKKVCRNCRLLNKSSSGCSGIYHSPVNHRIDSMSCEEWEERPVTNEEIGIALYEMVNQFAYTTGNQTNSLDEELITGGLSALEIAFDALGIDEKITRRELHRKWRKSCT